MLRPHQVRVGSSAVRKSAHLSIIHLGGHTHTPTCDVTKTQEKADLIPALYAREASLTSFLGDGGLFLGLQFEEEDDGGDGCVGGQYTLEEEEPDQTHVNASMTIIPHSIISTLLLFDVEMMMMRHR